MRTTPRLLAVLAVAALAGCADNPAGPAASPPEAARRNHTGAPFIEYEVHIQNIGWQGWVTNGQVAGTPGQGLRVEALRLNLYDFPEPHENRSPAEVCYRAHVQNVGWQAPVCGNWQEVGTTGQSLRMEAVEIWLRNAPADMGICYQAWVEGIGWQGRVCNGQTAGTTGQSLRMEGLIIDTY